MCHFLSVDYVIIYYQQNYMRNGGNMKYFIIARADHTLVLHTLSSTRAHADRLLSRYVEGSGYYVVEVKLKVTDTINTIG